MKKVSSLLSILNRENFKSVVNQFQELDFDTEERVRGIVDLMFKKIVIEPEFSIVCALLCKYLSAAVNSEGKNINFTEFLIAWCLSKKIINIKTDTVPDYQKS